MASTYVNNLRLNEMATGDASGSWGTITNTNLEIIGQATAWGTRAIANASTDNITIADGALDADRCLGLKLTGGGQACTVTLLPNTSSKTWFMYNATSYTLTFTCGSGANVAILAGQTKIIATDGLGSGGVVHDLLTAVNLAGTTQTAAVTTQGTLTVGVDDTGYDVQFFGATSGKNLLWDESADSLIITGSTSNQGTVTVGVDDTGYDVKFFGATSGKSLLWDESADSLIVTGTTTLVGTTNLDAVDIDGATQIDATVTVGVNDTGYDVKLFGATAGAYMLWDESADDLKLVGAAGLTVAGDIDVDGTTNLDVVDIDGAVDMASTLTVNDSVTLQSSGSSKPVLTIKNTNADTTPPSITFQKDSASPADGDEVANINFYGDDSGGNVAAYAGLKVLADDVTDGTEDGSFHFRTMVAGTIADRVVLGTTLAASVPILSTITTNTAATFSTNVGSQNADILQVIATGSSTSANIKMSTTVSGAQAQIRLGGDNALMFANTSSDTERMRITGSGQVLITNTTAGAVGYSLYPQSGNGVLVIQNQGYGDGFTHNLFQFNGTTAGAIVGNESSTAYNTSSDYRLKENVDYDWNATARLKQLKPARFNWIIDDTNTLVDGFLAHEVSSIVPEAITGTKDAMTTEVLYVEGDELPEGISVGDVKEAVGPDYQGIDQSKLVPLLVKTIQELEARITALEA